MRASTTLRLEILRIGLDTDHRVTDIQVRQHLALLAFALAAMVATAGAMVTLRVPSGLIVAGGAVLVTVVLMQLRGLWALAADVRRKGQDATISVENLMQEELAHDAHVESDPA